VITLLATDLQPHKLLVGTGVVREGEVGEPLYLIVAGSPQSAAGETPVGTRQAMGKAGISALLEPD
jgi:hypothetical protein